MTTIPSQALRPATIPGPAADTRKPHILFPDGACDCHAHVFGPQEFYPYLPDAAYIPPDASPRDYARMLCTIGCRRAVIVQPSIYGTDNRCLVAALTSGALDFRGVAVVDSGIGDPELETLHRAGVRGVRVNLASKTPGITLDQAPGLAMRIEPLGWHLQFFVRIGQVPSLEQVIAQIPVPCVIDHFGHAPAAGGVESAEFKILLRLARLDHVWFKLIGPYRISRQHPRYPDVAPLVRALIAAAPDRCLWGTDWPHPNTEYMPNDGDLADALGDWLPDEQTRRGVLVDNPGRLYGFM
jgi:predicted TIM-barrel fold metal-dependent hydrolase